MPIEERPKRTNFALLGGSCAALGTMGAFYGMIMLKLTGLGFHNKMGFRGKLAFFALVSWLPMACIPRLIYTSDMAYREPFIPTEAYLDLSKEILGV